MILCWIYLSKQALKDCFWKLWYNFCLPDAHCSLLNFKLFQLLFSGFYFRKEINFLCVSPLPPFNILWPQRVIGIKFLLTVSSPESHFTVMQVGKWSPIEETLIVKQTLLVNTVGSLWRKVWKTCTFVLGCEGFWRQLLLFTNCSVGCSMKS